MFGTDDEATPYMLDASSRHRVAHIFQSGLHMFAGIRMGLPQSAGGAGRLRNDSLIWRALPIASQICRCVFSEPALPCYATINGLPALDAGSRLQRPPLRLTVPTKFFVGYIFLR